MLGTTPTDGLETDHEHCQDRDWGLGAIGSKVEHADSVGPRAIIRRKLRTIRRVYERGGIRGAFVHSTARLGAPIRRRVERASRAFDRWYRSDNWWLGKLVELTGNRYVHDGFVISLDNPRIATRLKSRFWRGDYEQDERRMVARHVRPDLPVIEVGGCIGVVSCIANRSLQNPEKHVVVEANPYLVPTLEANRDQNGCKFKVLNRALAYGAPRLAFFLHDLFVGGSANRETGEQVEVQTTNLQEVLDQHGFDVCNLIFDAEGAEVDLLQHEAEVLRARVAVLIVELHSRIVGDIEIALIVKRLEELGFTLVAQSGNSTQYDSICVYVNRQFQ